MTQPAASIAIPEPRPHPLASIAALLASVLLLTAGTNLQGVLLPIRRQMEGATTQQIGLLSSGWSAGFVLACLVVGRLVSAVGHVRCFAGLAALSAAASLLLLPLDDPALWIALRVVIGFCFGGLSMIIESWLNERSSSTHRGGVFAAYMTISLLASLGGTLSLDYLDPMQAPAYTLMGVAVVLSIVPVAFTRAPVPKPIEPYRIDLPGLYRLCPTGVTGCLLVGLTSGALGGLLPAYGLAINLSTHDVAKLLAALLLGGAVAYYPTGALSDHVDRRFVIIALACVSAALCAFLVLHPYLSQGVILACVAALGFFQYPLYGLCVAMTNDRVREQSFSEIASELLIIYGGGTVFGPPLAAWLMRYGERYLFGFVGVVLTVMALFTAIRVARRPRPPQEVPFRTQAGTTPNTMQVFRPHAAKREI